MRGLCSCLRPACVGDVSVRRDLSADGRKEVYYGNDETPDRPFNQMDKAIFKLILEAMRLDKADTLVALGGHDRRWQQRVATRIGLAHPNGDTG